MNRNDFSEVQQMELDRLIDDELSSDERRGLIASLEAQPDGWRRCALAFLEAQTWQGELGALVCESEVPRKPSRRGPTRLPEQATRTPPKIHSMQFPRSSWWMSAAALLLVAFTIGWGLGQRVPPWPGLDPFGDSPIAAVPQAPAQAPDEPPSAVQPAAQQPLEAGRQDDVLQLWVRDERGEPRTLDVPLVDADVLDRRWGVQFQSSVSEDDRRRLEEQGYQVQTRRRYAPFWFDEERPLVMPVEDVQIVPVSRPVH